MDLKLKGKKAIVTGSSGGIGEGIAKCLAQEGVEVMVQGRKKPELERVVKEIKAAGGVAYFVEGDLTSDKDAERIVSHTLETFKHVDILINNAGAFPQRKWMESTPESWMELFDANVISMVRMIHGFLPQMKKSDWGRIIQIASVAGNNAGTMLPEYSVTKAANINMTISLAKELAGSGVTVNAVSPGPVATPGTKELFMKMAAANNWKGSWEEIQTKVAKEQFPNLAGRFGTMEEVGTLVTYLCSLLADFMTAGNYAIDGGRV